MSAIRSRWAALGAAVAVTLGAGTTAQHFVSAGAAPADGSPVLVSITPCRLTDTRASDQVGPRGAPIGDDDTLSISAHGTNGDCTIPTGAVALALNVTALGASLPTYLTIWAAGTDQPEASSLNPSPGAPPTPNAVTTPLSGSGLFNIYNRQGSVDVIVDVTGYYVGHGHDDRYYTKSQIEVALGSKADTSSMYTKAQIDSALGDKADTADVYSQAEIDGMFASTASLQRVVIVPSAGTPAVNGAALSDAIDVVTAAVPTASQPWMILLEPGRYEATSYPSLPGYTTLAGLGRGSTYVVDTDDGPAITASGPVTLRDLSVEQGGTAGTAAFTDDVEMASVRVRVGSTSSLAGAVNISGTGVEARFTDVILEAAGAGNLYGIVIQSGATLELLDSQIDGLYRGITAGSAATVATLTIRNSLIDATSTAISSYGGTISVDDSILAAQVSLGGIPYDQVVDLTVRNSAIDRIFFNGSASTAARTATIESSTMTGGVDSGAGDGLTTANVFNTHMNGTVNADNETCYGVSTLTGFNDVTCP